MIPTIIWINCLLSLTRIDHEVDLIMYSLEIDLILHSSYFCLSLVPLKFEATSSSWVKISPKHFCVYFFRVVDFILLSLSLTAVSSGRLDTIIGEMLGRVCGRWVGVSGVGCVGKGLCFRLGMLQWGFCGELRVWNRTGYQHGWKFRLRKWNKNSSLCCL